MSAVSELKSDPLIQLARDLVHSNLLSPKHQMDAESGLAVLELSIDFYIKLDEMCSEYAKTKDDSAQRLLENRAAIRKFFENELDQMFLSAEAAVQKYELKK